MKPKPLQIDTLPPATRTRWYSQEGALSPKALGITCAFFGIVLCVGAIAALSSGKLNWHDAVQAIRASMSLFGGAMLVAISAQLFKKAGGR